jgi:hypothetical protein
MRLGEGLKGQGLKGQGLKGQEGVKKLATCAQTVIVTNTLTL